MSKIYGFILALLFIGCATSKEVSPQAQKQPPTPEQIQEAMAKASAIGENHQKFDPLIGEYKVEAKFWMGPNTEPQQTTGTAKYWWVLNGHYVAMYYKSTFNGEPFEGKGLFGYDNLGKRYQSIWVDSIGTEIMISEGSLTPGTSTIVFEGEFQCPINKGPIKAREVLNIGTDRHTFEMYHTAPDGSGEFKAMEITYIKSADAAGGDAHCDKAKKKRCADKKKGKKRHSKR